MEAQNNPTPVLPSELLPPEQPTSKRKFKYKKILIIVLGLVITSVLGFYLFVYIGFNGGFKQTYLSWKAAPDATSGKVKNQREKAVQTIEANMQALEDKAGFTKLVTSQDDVCYSGQHNFEVKDPFAHICKFRETRYYAFNGDFRQSLTNYDKTLIASEWEPFEGNSIPSILTNYYDVYMNTSDPVILHNFGGKYRVSDLPTPGYEKKVASDSLELGISWAQQDTPSLFLLEYSQHVGNSYGVFHEEYKFNDVVSLFPKWIEKNQFVLSIGVQETYYQD